MSTRAKAWALRQQMRELAQTLDLYLEGGAPWMASSRNMADAYHDLVGLVSLWGEVAEDELAERDARGGWVKWGEAR